MEKPSHTEMLIVDALLDRGCANIAAGTPDLFFELQVMAWAGKHMIYMSRFSETLDETQEGMIALWRAAEKHGDVLLPLERLQNWDPYKNIPYYEARLWILASVFEAFDTSDRDYPDACHEAICAHRQRMYEKILAGIKDLQDGTYPGMKNAP